MNLLKSMDRTEADIRGRLSESGYPPEAVDEAIEYLRSYKYIDDMRYASEYIRFKSSSMSRKQIEVKLAGKGIDRETVEAAFGRYEAESGEDTCETEKKLIEKLIRKKYPDGVSDISYEDRQKLFAYLYGKGFSIASIEEVYGSIPGT
jgi:regulatory protein